MYKSNIVFIISFIILSSSSLLFYIIYFEDDTHKYFQSSFQKNKSNAPIIVSLFENVNNDGHDQFISSESCLSFEYKTVLNACVSDNKTISDPRSAHIVIGKHFLTALSTVVLPIPITDLKLNSFATLDMIVPCGEWIDVAVDTVLLNLFFISFCFWMNKDKHCLTFPPFKRSYLLLPWNGTK